jgi:hypothetical protein
MSFNIFPNRTFTPNSCEQTSKGHTSFAGEVASKRAKFQTKIYSLAPSVSANRLTEGKITAVA